MTDAESPGTLFELLYLFFSEGPKRVVYDNGCNLLTYILNRDPVWARHLRIFIDALDLKGHTGCATSLDAGMNQSSCCNVRVHQHHSYLINNVRATYLIVTFLLALLSYHQSNMVHHGHLCQANRYFLDSWELC
jgi:hypothetical protein